MKTTKFHTATLQVHDAHYEHPILSRGYAWLMVSEVVDGVTSKGLVPTDEDGWVKTMAGYLYRLGFYKKDRRDLDDEGNVTGIRQVKVARGGLNADLTTLFPAWSWVILSEGLEDPGKVEGFLSDLAGELARMFERETGRRVLGVACHLDTKNIHFDIWSSRVGDDNYFLPDSSKAVGLLGPDAIGQIRQARWGFQDTNTPEAVRAEWRRVNEILRRDRDAIDYQMMLYIDERCEAVWGSSQWRAGAFAAYPQYTALVELYHKLNRLQALKRLSAELEKKIAAGGVI